MYGWRDVQSDRRDPKSAAVREILSYFVHNPDAADSLTELARWRLMQETVRHTVESTHEALNWLIAEGYVREEKRVGTERIFQLDPARRADAEDFLRKLAEDEDRM